MQLRHVFSELRQGLRRNASMHVAVVLTLFVSLTLAGVGALLSMQADKTADLLGTQLQIAVQLCTDEDVNNPLCVGEVTEPERDAVEAAIEENPEVADYRYKSKEEAYEQAKEIFPESFDGPNPPVTVDDMPQAYVVTLEDPAEADGIKSAVEGLDGVSNVQDQRDTLNGIFEIIDALQIGSWVGAGVLLLAALLLVANTIRLAALARRKEIGIMRLVGASTLYIALPFLLEALVTAAVGVLLAGAALAAFTKFGVQDGLAQGLDFLPWVGWPEYVDSLIGVWPVGIAILGPVLTVAPTLLLTRKYIKV